MTHRKVNALLVVVLVLGLLLRIAAWQIEPPSHPDEYYQYLEPGWLRLTGVGVEPWEWRDGIRSWVLPAYNGAWMALLRQLGVSGGRIVSVLQLHWALISLVLVWGAYRGGLTLARRVGKIYYSIEFPRTITENEPPIGWQGGLLAAALCSWFPLLVMQSPHTFSETPSMLALVLSLVTAVEVVENEKPSSWFAVGSGILAALGVCFRIANGPVALVPLLVLLCARRWRFAFMYCCGGVLPLMVFGIVDWLTWGGFLSSYVGYVKFNFIDGKAAKFGILPGNWYWKVVIDRLPTFIAAFSYLVYVRRKAVWPYGLAAFGLLVYLTTQGHKEERFIIAFWPFLLIALSGVIGGYFVAQSYGLGERFENRQRFVRWFRRPAIQVSVVLALALATTLDSLVHSARSELDVMKSLTSTTHASRGLTDAQSWVGKREDVVGVLVQQMGAGYAGYGGLAPMLVFDYSVRESLVYNPILNYAIVERGSTNYELIVAAGYDQLRSFGNYDVYRRSYETLGFGPDYERLRSQYATVKAKAVKGRKLELASRRKQHAL